MKEHHLCRELMILRALLTDHGAQPCIAKGRAGLRIPGIRGVSASAADLRHAAHIVDAVGIADQDPLAFPEAQHIDRMIVVILSEENAVTAEIFFTDEKMMHEVDPFLRGGAERNAAMSEQARLLCSAPARPLPYVLARLLSYAIPAGLLPYMPAKLLPYVPAVEYSLIYQNS